MQTIDQGGSVLYNITVTNNGNDNDTFVFSTLEVTNNETVVEGWNVSFSKSTITLGLNDNETVIVNITASPNALADNNTITIRAVSQNVSQDGTHASNTTDLIVEVNRIYDAIAIKCDEYEKWIIPGRSVDFILSIQNNGNNNTKDIILLSVDEPAGWSMKFDNALTTIELSILGESKEEVTLTVTAPSGAELGVIKKIHIYAVLERDDNNLSASPDPVPTVTVSLPDLIVKNMTFSKSHPRVGEEVTVNATVCNVGKVDAFSPSGFEVCLYVDGRLINTTYINQITIKPDENITVSINWNTTGVESGQRIIKVSVGAYNETLDELNSANNHATKTIPVGKIRAWWKLGALIAGIIAVVVAIILIGKIRRRR